MPFCQTCHGHYFDAQHHRCLPKWWCWDNNYAEEPGEAVYAVSGGIAAEQFVRMCYDACAGETYTVFTRNDVRGVVERWRVVSELVVVFNAERVEAEDADPEGGEG